MDEVFLKDAVMDRLSDDVPEVAAAALKVLEVSEEVNKAIDEGCSAPCRPVGALLTLCSVVGSGVV